MTTPTEFEQLLEKVAPDIYLLHRMSSTNPQIWQAVRALMGMVTQREKGRIVVYITGGQVEHVEKVQMLSAYTGTDRVE